MAGSRLVGDAAGPPFRSAAADRDESQIERAVHWTSRENADAFVGEGVTLFTTEIHPTDDGYDFTELKDMIAWRDALEIATDPDLTVVAYTASPNSETRKALSLLGNAFPPQQGEPAGSDALRRGF